MMLVSMPLNIPINLFIGFIGINSILLLYNRTSKEGPGSRPNEPRIPLYASELSDRILLRFVILNLTLGLIFKKRKIILREKCQSFVHIEKSCTFSHVIFIKRHRLGYKSRKFRNTIFENVIISFKPPFIFDFDAFLSSGFNLRHL